MRLFSANEPRRYVRRVRYLLPGREYVRLPITVDRPMPCALSCNGSESNNWEGQCAIVAKNRDKYRMSLFIHISHVHLRPFTKQPTGREDTLRVPYHMAREPWIRMTTQPGISPVFGESADPCFPCPVAVSTAHDAS